MKELKHERGVEFDTQLTVKDLQELVKRFKKAVKEKKGKDFPDDPQEQMWGAIAAVFGSWNNERAIVYRRQYNYPHDWGTAANICSMVFGNMGDDSGTGVAFTRDPATGEKVFYGEYLINAQGEDVVAGIRTPKKIAEMEKDMPVVYKELLQIRETLENHYRNVQDIEFTIQKGKLWMLQTRNGKRTGFAAVRFAVDFVEEGKITKEDRPERRLGAARRPESTAATDLRPRGKAQGQGDRQGHQRRPRCRDRPHHVLRRGRRGVGGEARQTGRARQAGRERSGHPGPSGDESRRHPRHAGGRRHLDRRRAGPRRTPPW